MDDCQPHVALGRDDLHINHALGELDVLVELVEELVELVEELEELDDAHVIDKSSLKLPREALLVAHAFDRCGRRWGDLCCGVHVAPQVLELLAVVVLDVVPRHLVSLGVGALVLPLVVIDIVVLVLA